MKQVTLTKVTLSGQISAKNRLFPVKRADFWVNKIG